MSKPEKTRDDAEIKRLVTPVTDEAIRLLSVGDRVLLTGVVYTARDAAHKRMAEIIEAGEPGKNLPFDFRGQIVYYAGPSPARPGRQIGSVGPTTSGRMDAYAPLMIGHGLKVMMGKGRRSEAVKESIRKHCGLYLVAVGGAAALISRSVIKADIVAFPDLGPEAIYRLEVADFPVVVGIDSQGRDIYPG